jgi:TolB protein
LERLTSDAATDRNPTWSPDGRMIAFVRDRGETGDTDNDIYLLDVATKRVTKQLTDNDVQDGNPVWSIDGKQIAFYRAFGDGFHIMVINVDGTGEQDLMEGRAGRNLDPNWR